MSLIDATGASLRLSNPALESPVNTNLGEMRERVIPRMQGDYVTAPWDGKNPSNVQPIGKNVLVRMDAFVSTFGGGKLAFLSEQVERMNLGSESGTIYAIGDQAFKHNSDHTINDGYKPVPGERVYCEKYAGREIMGDDGVKYRLMADGCIAGLYRGEHALIRGDAA